MRTWPCQVEYLAWALGKLGFLCLWGQQPQKGVSNTGTDGHTAQSIPATQATCCWDQKGRARQKCYGLSLSVSKVDGSAKARLTYLGTLQESPCGQFCC